MSQKSVETVIGRLVTDEALRAHFWDDSRSTLTRLQDAGLDLTVGEIEALRRTPLALWDFVAKCVHPRLQKIALRRGAGER